VNLTDVTFHIWFDGGEWVVSVDPEKPEIARGITPVGAMINAELQVRRDMRSKGGTPRGPELNADCGGDT
jgi:hypothetical protein